MSGKAPLYAGRWEKAWRKEVQGAWADGAIAHIYDGNNELVEIEYYEFTGEYCGKEPLVNTRTETADGRLLIRQIAHRISDTEQDLHVMDAAGELRLIIHHSDMDRGEPYTIREEWITPDPQTLRRGSA